jgi:hypothetical protein
MCRKTGRKPNTSTIQSRAESQRGKPAPRTQDPLDESRSVLTLEQRVADLCDRLWGLCSPLKLAEYESPWNGIAADLRARLAAAVTDPPVYTASAKASRLGYTACLKSLTQAAPAVRRIMIDIRGLANAVAPALVADKKDNAPPEIEPGVPLIYEEISVH